MAKVSFSDFIKYLPVVDQYVQVVHDASSGATDQKSVATGISGVIGLAVPFVKAANPQYAPAIDILVAEIEKLLTEFGTSAQAAPAPAPAPAQTNG